MKGAARDFREPEKALAAAISTLNDMENLAARLRLLIVAQPPLGLIGYINSRRILGAMRAMRSNSRQQTEGVSELSRNTDGTQFVLEYVHAVLASTTEIGTNPLDENACVGPPGGRWCRHGCG